ncbi:hypothetical protein [Aeromonas hydrophila]|uniref:hypothetical protein n=1 Tax=Aeromonas hydrophila TaxID=644 RepID=UPI003EC60A39
MLFADILLKPIRALNALITSKIAKYQSRKTEKQLISDSFLIKFESEINRIIVWKGQPYRAVITDSDIAISNSEGKPVDDLNLIIDLLRFIWRNQ